MTPRRRYPSPRFMEGYYCARQAWEAACEYSTMLYAVEVAEYKQQHPPILFKNWLIQSRGMQR